MLAEHVLEVLPFLSSVAYLQQLLGIALARTDVPGGV
jgi:hypothetical protein